MNLLSKHCSCHSTPSLSRPQNISLLNMNHYATKKTLAQGMLDLALLTANVSQLKYLLDVGDLHPYFHLLLPLIIVSICLQVGKYTKEDTRT